MNEEHAEQPRLRLGISACLMGETVRYDGGDRHQPWVTTTLARGVELVPVCPEVAIGLGVPRPPIQLEGDPARPRAVGVVARDLDATARLERFARLTARELAEVSGWVLKARSPSCGPRVKVHDAGPRAMSSGIFTRELQAALPLLPTIDEESLADPALRDNFLERIFAYRRWQALVARGITPARLERFHAAHKMILMAHSPTRYRRLGQMVAERAGATRYSAEFMATLQLPATARKHANVLQHLAGYLKRQLDAADRQELLAAIEALRQERTPLVVPLTLLRHHFRRHPHPWVAGQWYLYPSEAEALLRSL